MGLVVEQFRFAPRVNKKALKSCFKPLRQVQDKLKTGKKAQFTRE